MKHTIALVCMLIISFFPVYCKSNSTVSNEVILTSRDHKYISKDNCITLQLIESHIRCVKANWASGSRQFSLDNGITWLDCHSDKSVTGVMTNGTKAIYQAGKLFFAFNSGDYFIGELRISNYFGNTIRKEFVKVTEGHNSFEFDLSDLPKGGYYVVLTYSSNTKIARSFFVY